MSVIPERHRDELDDEPPDDERADERRAARHDRDKPAKGWAPVTRRLPAVGQAVTKPLPDWTEFAEAFCAGYIAHKEGLADTGDEFAHGLMDAYRSSGRMKARRYLGVDVDPISDEMVERAAVAMHQAYTPDEGDDPEQCWRDAMHAALVAALLTRRSDHP